MLDWDEQAGLTVELGSQPGILTERLRLAESPESPVAGPSLVAFQKAYRVSLLCRTRSEKSTGAPEKIDEMAWFGRLEDCTSKRFRGSSTALFG